MNQTTPVLLPLAICCSLTVYLSSPQWGNSEVVEEASTLVQIYGVVGSTFT